MKFSVVLGVLVLFVYAEAASLPVNQEIEISPEDKDEKPLNELTREKRQFGFGGFGLPGIGIGYAPGFGYGGYPGYGNYGYGKNYVNEFMSKER